MSDDPDRTAPTPGPGWWMDDDGVLRPPGGDPGAASTATATEPPRAAVPPPPQAGPSDLPPGPSDDAFGSSFTWAFSALRQQAGRLLLVGLAVLVLYVVVAILAVVIMAIAAQIESALVRATLSFVVIALVLAATAWAWLLLSRSWFRVAHGDDVPLDVVNPAGIGPVVAVLVLVSPVWLLTGPFGSAFVVTALVLVHEPLPGVAAVGRMLAEVFSSARRFVHTLLISLGVGAASLVLFAVISWSSLIVTTAVTSTSVQGWFDEGDDLFRDVDESLTTLAGFGINAVVGAVVGYAIITLGGLWAAGHLRRLTGRPLGTSGPEPIATGNPT